VTVTTIESLISTSTTTVTQSFTGSGSNFMMNLNGSLYYADNVTTDFTAGSPGYSFFHNASVTFQGVTFQTYCPPADAGCPPPPGATVTVTGEMTIGAVRLNATFPDYDTETMAAPIGDSNYVLLLSHHTDPQAGILIVYSDGYKAYLLVS
jgi:hypothetical protein